MEFTWVTTEVPHFGEVLLITGTCDCGFKHSDTITLSQKEPSRHTLRICCTEDLSARVIRSPSGTIRLPEFGVDVEPGPASDAVITNVEGVLDRVKEVVTFATRAAEKAGDSDRTQRGHEILERIEEALKGQYSFTLIVEDPLGNSSIISENRVVTPLT
jgi:zinc finger protein